MHVKHIWRLMVALMLIIVSVSGFASAQEENLLSNAGFEDGFNSSGVASDWQSWVSSAADAPGFQEAPTFLQATDAGDNGLIPQVRSGSDAQAMFSFFATHDAGVYQQVSGLSSGSELRFSVYAHVFSNNLSDVDQSENPGGVTIRVGIDPTGGTDPFSDDVVYTEPFITYDTYVQYSTIATADSDTVTVFVRSTVTEPVQNTIVFLDDAVLNVTPESSEGSDETEEPTEEATEETPEPTETEEEIKDPTPTREGDTGAVETEETPTEDVATEEPTEEATEEETEETPTEAPTAEPTPEVPISEEFPGQVLHTVQRGDTVGALASRYGSSTQAIIQVNGLNESALIFVGQGLVVPVRIVPATETPSATPVVVVVTATPATTDDTNAETPDTSGDTYTVQRGDTLSTIANRFNTTIGALVQLNGIANPNRILVGQVLNIPATGGSVEPVPTSAPTEVPVTEAPETDETEEQDNSGIIPPESDDAPTTYVVQPGDNLYRIALSNGISLTALGEANNITNFNLIFVGQELTIP